MYLLCISYEYSYTPEEVMVSSVVMEGCLCKNVDIINNNSWLILLTMRKIIVNYKRSLKLLKKQHINYAVGISDPNKIKT